MLLLGTGAADSPVTEWYTPTVYFSSPIAGGVDGCPVLAGSTFDPHELCAADLGADWTPVGVAVAQVCPPSALVGGALIENATMAVYEHIVTEPDPGAAVALVRARVSCALSSRSRLFITSRKLPVVPIPDTLAEAQLVISFPYGGPEIETLVVIGNVVLAVGVSDYEGVAGSATVLRIVNLAIHRFQNPRSSGGPFAPIIVPVPPVPSVP